MNTFQVIVISLSETHRAELMRQIQEMELEKYVRVHIQHAVTPDTANTYLKDSGLTPSEQRVACCARSHYYALEYACLESSPPFSVILEEDVAFHKTQFLHAVRELMEKWTELVTPSRICSLGWVPIALNREWYESVPGKPLTCFHGSRVRQVTISGLQAYLFRKEDIRPHIKMFLQPTYNQYKEVVLAFQKATNKRSITPLAVDAVINILFGQTIVYPPLCIEQNAGSTLGHSNWRLYWKPFFTPRPYQLNDYYTFDTEKIESIFELKKIE